MADRFDKLQVEFIDQDESVQDVADAIGSSGDVPERYVRPEMEADPVIVDADGYSLPVIDMSRLIDPEFSEEEIAKLGSACEDWGFFQLVNHGVDGESLKQVKADVAEFFSLPLQEKMAVAIQPNGLQGFGHHFVFSKDQKLDWVDLLFLTTRPAEERSMDFWPTNPPTFRDSLDKYSQEIADVSDKLFKFMAIDLGVDEEALLGAFKGKPHQSVRINHYPPCRQAADRVLGLSPHTDGVGMTLLLQVNGVQGLQIRKDGRWFAVQNLPGALIVNVGDVLEIITNGKYRSIEHRAVINPDKERITIAAFQSAPLSCTVGPLQELLMNGEPRYKTVDGVEFTKGYFAAKLEGRRYLESLKLGV
ncbi:2-oxoglutarate-dependent dioxygenase 11-like isoform X2 [Oryza brachyantha]|uniref:Fe2OG dioxygenase domain-containing protein n=1 Tax=Oryza brachyantha TaxID=4533 RepID=J3N4U8_ORYBR|nr:2-oxoglutarate-dependent dioxygenase 11-like isoform X2 [Oryza brachyantha]